ncbi:MAG: hypothetical protein M3032_01600 [Verrucomicrobiota bacterium]|nr:hypothetical protein [Verrucomicrobiota bacterium]
MKTIIATCLLACSMLAACQTAPTTASRNAAPRAKLADRMLAQNQTNPYAATEPAPPAEGPEDIPATRTVDPVRNPALLPTPLLRANAASGL